MAFNGAGRQRTGDTVVVGLELVNALQACQRRLRMRVLDQQSGYGHHRRQYASAEYGTGYQCTHGHFPLHDQQSADSHQTGIADLLNRRR